MLDENLPTFFFKPSTDTPLSTTIYLRQSGNDLSPEYTFKRPDPSLPASKNCYAVALYDSYNSDVLFAEVLVQPEWSAPSLSAAELRAQNGIPPPPVPIVPNGFVVQLYNPDQQVSVRQIAGTWKDSAYWEFEMPCVSFRAPSASALDRSQNDPAASEITPKVAFKWKRDGKFSKDLSCFLCGRTAEGKRSKEPDIMIAMYKGGKDLTVYEPNLHRVDVEDFKGLEVVLLLSAAVIKDIFFNASREMFNISSPNTNGGARKRVNSGPVIKERRNSISPVMSGGVFTGAAPKRRDSHPVLTPTTNARTQWEIDAETARLKAVVEQEEREREAREREEEARIRKMLEMEEREARRRNEEVERETERLRRQYGVTAVQPPRIQFAGPPPHVPPRQNVAGGMHQWTGAPHAMPVPVQRPVSTSPYLQAPGRLGQASASSSGFFGLGGGRGDRVRKKRSVFF